MISKGQQEKLLDSNLNFGQKKDNDAEVADS
jgi:hypothetical protein